MKIKKRYPFPSIENMVYERLDNVLEGSVTYSFFYGEKPCGHLVLNSPIAKIVAAYRLIQRDLNSAYSGIECLIDLMEKSIHDGIELRDNEDVEFVVQKSLFQAAVITYGKCFADASGGKGKSKGKPRGVKLEKKIVKGLPPSQIETHDYLIRTRNNYIAHGGITNQEQSLCYVIVSPKNKIMSNVLTMEAHAATASIERLKSILELIKNIQTSLREMQIKKSEIISRVELPKFTDEEIRRNSVSSLKLFNLGDRNN